LRRYFSITVCCLFTYIFPHMPFLSSATNHRKFTSNMVKKENRAFCIVSDDLFIFFPHSSTLVCDIKGLWVEFYFWRNVASGEKIWSSKRGEGNKYRFWTIIYTPARFFSSINPIYVSD
jgi:hypothetical protein